MLRSPDGPWLPSCGSLWTPGSGQHPRKVLYATMRVAGHGAPWIRRCATVLNRTLELARKRGLIDANPARDAARPRLTRSKPYAPSSGEVIQLLARTRQVDPELADAVTVLASTGMRVGELLGLWWGDVDLGAGELHVASAVSDGGPGVRIVPKPTKRSTGGMFP